MKKLVILIALFSMFFISCTTYSPCLNKAFKYENLYKKYPVVIKAGEDNSGRLHAEAVVLVTIKGVITEVPCDGDDTIVQIIPQDQYRKYYTFDEALKNWGQSIRLLK